MWWGGLRGSVGLALALAIFHTVYSRRTWGGAQEEEAHGSLPCRDIPMETLFINCIIVLFTVVINGSLVSRVLEWVGLTAVPDDRRFMLSAVRAKLEADWRAASSLRYSCSRSWRVACWYSRFAWIWSAFRSARPTTRSA